MDIIIQSIKVTLISSVIGIIVGSFFQFANAGEILPGVINGAISGAIIGLVSQNCFMFVYLKLRQHPFFAFTIVIFIIAVGTLAFCLFWNVAFPVPGIPIIIVSEILGISATGLLFSNYSKLNKRLKGKISKLSGKID
jgi:hypothetical protein